MMLKSVEQDLRDVYDIYCSRKLSFSLQLYCTGLVMKTTSTVEFITVIIIMRLLCIIVCKFYIKEKTMNDQKDEQTLALRSISWHLKRIADSLEVLAERVEFQEPQHNHNPDTPAPSTKLKQMLAEANRCR